MDNHNSHITLESVELAKNHGLDLLTLRLITATNFNLLMWVYLEPSENSTAYFVINGVCHIVEKHCLYKMFAGLSNKAFVKSCTLENITSSFRRTGIFPFNSEIFTFHSN